MIKMNFKNKDTQYIRDILKMKNTWLKWYNHCVHFPHIQEFPKLQHENPFNYAGLVVVL